jgi:pimeloyl-ACP methyl ester carboxylesterase
MSRAKQREFIEEYAVVNGIEQYFLHYLPSDDGGDDGGGDGEAGAGGGDTGTSCGVGGGGTGGTDTGGEVMLIIHGGPGFSEAHLAYYAKEGASKTTTVYYDQRGTGKTLSKNPTKGDDVTFEQLFSDLRETVLYIKRRYQRDKIILSGHSWGSLLGLTYAEKYPEDLRCYIGCGQVVDMKRGEKLLFDKLVEAAAGNTAVLRLLHSLGDYPFNIENAEQMTKAVSCLAQVKDKLGVSIDANKVQLLTRKSPVFKLTDIASMMKAQKLVGHLYEALLDFNAETMRDFKIPMYFVHAESDWQVPLELAREYYEGITAPDKDFYVVENAGHFTLVDNPEGTIATTSAIIKRLSEDQRGDD